MSYRYGYAAGYGALKPGGAVSQPVTSAMIMGQSEMQYLFDVGALYRSIAQPVPGNGNLTVYRQDSTGAAVVKTEVNAASVAAGQVNPAMTALSAFLAFARPGRLFAVGDGAVPGTSRFDLGDDSTDGSDGRTWADFANVAAAIEADHGSVQHLIECWFNADAGYLNTFKANFWPLYFGANGDGSLFTLGNTVNSRRVDHCLWDYSAAAGAKGRGLFAKAATKWWMATPMPYFNAPQSPAAEMLNFSEQPVRMIEPVRANMIAMAAEPLAQSIGLTVGPSAHVCRFGGASTIIHPDTADKDGQVLLMWPLALQLLRASGMTIGEPTVVAIEGPNDGSYADLVVDLPNGGNLTTLAALRGTAYGGTSPHQQPVTGVEVTRSGGTRRPVYKTTEASYPANARGTVTVVDAGSGNPRRGRVRITPTAPFAYGDVLSYLRGQATACLQETRDYNLYPWFLIEHLPGLYDASAMYPFEGVAVRPFQQDIAVPVPAPTFTARGAYFDGTDSIIASTATVPAGSAGIASFWFRQSGTWATNRTIFEARVGSTQTIAVTSTTSGRLNFRLNQDGTGSDTFTVPASTFVGDTWYHVLWAWDYAAARFQIYVNGVALNTAAYSFAGSTKFDHAGATLTQFGIGALVNGTNPWVGDLGHVFVDVTAGLDLSVLANRQKFAVGGAPVDLGANGGLPLGVSPDFNSPPEWYQDGAAPAWSNHGTAGNGTVAGTLTASSSAPAY